MVVVTLVIDAPPSWLGGGGCLPASRVEMLLNYRGRTGGREGKQISRDNNHGNIAQLNTLPSVLVTVAGKEIKLKSSAVFHPMAETEVSSVKLEAGSRS